MTAGTVVYLHGMGGSRPGWADALRGGVDVMAPDYSDLLDLSRDVYAAPRVRSRDEARTPDAAHRASYLARQRELSRVVHGIGEAMPPGASWPAALPHPARLPDRLPLPQVLRTPLFGIDQVGRYLDDSSRRAAVVDRVRGQLTRAQAPVVVIAHSLGSVVMVDVLDDLPCEVAALVTIGSPLGHDAVAGALAPGPFPYDRVGWWANLVHLLDPVPFGRGIAGRFPAAYDVYLPVLAGLSARSAVRAVPSPGWPEALSAVPWITQGIARAATAHLETTYLSTRTMHAMIDFALDGQAVAA
ncbi:MAG: hypothetical protein ACKOMX_01485 [Actinomycetota bacterium]